MPQNIVHIAGDAFTFAEDTEFFLNSLVFPTLVHTAAHEVGDNVERGDNIENEEPVEGFIAGNDWERGSGCVIEIPLPHHANKVVSGEDYGDCNGCFYPQFEGYVQVHQPQCHPQGRYGVEHPGDTLRV